MGRREPVGSAGAKSLPKEEPGTSGNNIILAAQPTTRCDKHCRPGMVGLMSLDPSTTLADFVYAAILCRDFFGSAGIAEAVA